MLRALLYFLLVISLSLPAYASEQVGEQKIEPCERHLQKTTNYATELFYAICLDRCFSMLYDEVIPYHLQCGADLGEYCLWRMTEFKISELQAYSDCIKKEPMIGEKR